jgi:hypothetical protein
MELEYLVPVLVNWPCANSKFETRRADFEKVAKTDGRSIVLNIGRFPGVQYQNQEEVEAAPGCAIAVPTNL